MLSAPPETATTIFPEIPNSARLSRMRVANGEYEWGFIEATGYLSGRSRFPAPLTTGNGLVLYGVTIFRRFSARRSTFADPLARDAGVPTLKE